MKILALALLTGLALPLVRPSQEGSRRTGDQDARPGHPIAGMQSELAERFELEIQGSWILVDYEDLEEPDLRDTVEGFATFHDGFLTLLLQVRAFRSQILGTREQLFIDGGAYRYRFSERADLQTSSLIGFTNLNNDAQLAPTGSGDVDEYIVTLDKGLLTMRNTDDVLMTFRKTTAGEFPEASIRRLERRLGTFPNIEEDY